MRLLRHAAILLLVGAVSAAPAFADEISDQISKALTAYQNHDPEAALKALDTASAKLRQKRADQLKTLLPAAPADWTEEPAQTSAVSAGTLGGGTTASRIYRQGNAQVQVQFTTDSPMLQQMAELATSPLGLTPDAVTMEVGGQKFAYTAKDNSFMSLVGTVVVRIGGNKQVPLSALRSFVSAIDVAGLQNLTH